MPHNQDMLMMQKQFFEGSRSTENQLRALLDSLPVLDPGVGLPSPAGQLQATPVPVRQRLDEDTRGVVLTAGKARVATFEPPEAGGVLATCLRARAASTISVVEEAVAHFTDIGLFGVTPGNRWRDAAHFRPYYVVQAVAKAIDARPITEGMLDAACGALPGIPREAVELALTAALQVQSEGG